MSREEYVSKYIKGEINDFVLYLMERGIVLFNKKHEPLDKEQIEKIVNTFLTGR